jgi:hypothetical protein
VALAESSAAMKDDILNFSTCTTNSIAFGPAMMVQVSVYELQTDQSVVRVATHQVTSGSGACLFPSWLPVPFSAVE